MTDCEDIDECNMNIKFCGGLHCINTVGSYKCSCHDGYRIGVEKNSERCFDVDECLNRRNCPYYSLCENSKGGFSCICNDGFHGKNCIDVDECSTNDETCDIHANCTNTFGSYICACRNGFSGSGKQSDCHCEPGFFSNESSTCVDENECASNTHECDENAACFNTIGSYSCSCKNGYYGSGRTCVKGQCNDLSCPDNQRCVSPTTIQCTCNDGYAAINESCFDIDECLKETFTCHENSECVNTVGSYTCGCKEGFVGNENVCKKGICDKTMCSEREKKLCGSLTSSTCKCMDGFMMSDNTCVDVNECESSTSYCEKNAKCVNAVGNYQCVCKNGYQGESICTNIDECELGTHECHETSVCLDENGGYECECESGYNQDESGECIDIDECTLDPNLCDSVCFNIIGGFACSQE